MLKQRVAKLKGKMGVIEVGGSSELEKTSNFDLVEDAVKACESAFNYGYNLGGNLVIPKTINELEISDFDVIDTEILNVLVRAFKNVFRRVLFNKFEDSITADEYDSLIDISLESNACYNLITEKYDDMVINSCYTDVEILNTTVSIVSLLLSSNQFVSISMNTDEKNK